MKKIYCTGYKDDGYKIKLLHIMLLKRSTSVQSYDGEAKWMNFLIKDASLLKNIQIVGLKSVIVLKKNLIASPSTLKDIWKPK